MKVLILGGTREGRELATLLHRAGHDVTTSLAGRVTRPAEIAGAVRIGGFGGIPGLTAHLAAEGVDLVVDATHPFAERISANAVAASRSSGVALLRIERPSWRDHRLAARWLWVTNHDEAARAAAGHDRVLLTVGRQSLDHYRALPHVLARMVELPPEPLPASWEVRLDRGPFDIDSERALLREAGITALVTKDSGGRLTEAKLWAAAELDVTVIVVRRAPTPEGIPTVTTAREAVAFLG
ncbi:MAG: cobalt-precorrin-6A reductase [Propionibacteriaceae bacterium]|nr:cobalt-precorrin-6A reductase [Propionibacteriaceae bacterium]MDO5066908.1 cobalt-precorrin-6A reductase [Propionibacteriaceae bacterium]